MTTFITSIVVFTAIIMSLVLVLLLGRLKLVTTGKVNIIINQDEENELTVLAGDTVLNSLATQGIFLPSACGGKGSCGKCKVIVNAGATSDLLLTERPLVTRAEVRRGVRLACQIKVKGDMSLRLPVNTLQTREWNCTVRSNRNVATFIKELVLELTGEEAIPFKAGGYIQVECPPHRLRYTDFDIDDTFRDRWDQLDMWKYASTVNESHQRSYSIANYPGENGVLTLNVRIASPPLDQPEVPPGIVSSYLFDLKPGDTLKVAGPFGEFFASDSDAEMVFIGGGAGMAPMRSHIFDQLKRLQTTRKISFWYGARSLCEAFYVEEIDRLARDYDNFDWTLALSVPSPQDDWDGPCGFIHQVAYDHYLAGHSAPEDAEYYLCGPPAMINACQHMLDDLGVAPESIMFDKFG